MKKMLLTLAGLVFLASVVLAGELEHWPRPEKFPDYSIIISGEEGAGIVLPFVNERAKELGAGVSWAVSPKFHDDPSEIVVKCGDEKFGFFVTFKERNEGRLSTKHKEVLQSWLGQICILDAFDRAEKKRVEKLKK